MIDFSVLLKPSAEIIKVFGQEYAFLRSLFSPSGDEIHWDVEVSTNRSISIKSLKKIL